MSKSNQNAYNQWGLSNYPLVRIVVPYVLGLLLADSIQIPYPFIVLFFSLATLIIVSKRLSTFWFHFVLFISCFVFGNIWMEKSNSKLHSSNYSHHITSNKKQILAVKIVSTGEEKERSVLYEAKVLGVKKDATSKWEAVNGKIPIYLLDKDDISTNLSYGDTLIFEGYLNEFQVPYTKYHFDYQKYMFNSGYFHQVFIRENQILYHGKNLTELPLLLRARSKIQDILNESIQNPTTHSLMSAVLLNEKTNMNPELRNHFSKTGISHIIAISGMHVSILCGFLLFLIPFIRNSKIKIFIFLLAFILVWTYIAITKFPPSAIRAASMFTLGIIGIFLNRKVYSINNLIITALIMLIYQPLWIWDVGFQLSFLAVLSILCFNPSIQNLFKTENKILHYFWSIIAISLSVQFLVFPLILYYFNSFPLLVLLANIPAVIYSFILLSGSFILIAMYFIHPKISIILGQLLSYITEAFYSTIQWLSHLTPDVFQSFHISNIELILLYILVLTVMLSIYKKSLKSWIVSAAMLSLLVFTHLKEQQIKSKEDFIFIFQQRQSYYIFLKINNHGYFIQPPESSYDTYQYNITPLEKGYQLKTVDIFEWTLWEDVSLSSIILKKGFSTMNNDHKFSLRLLGFADIKGKDKNNFSLNNEQVIILSDVPYYLIDSLRNEYSPLTDSIHFLREAPYFAYLNTSSEGNNKNRSRVAK